jgi:prepilin-type N-terminal cleavage/methylation domain-containing protein
MDDFRTRGFSVIEVTVALIIIAVIAAVLAPLASSLMNVTRSSTAYDDLGHVYTAIVGNPSQGNFGYLGDVGDFPSSVMGLVSTDGTTGWNGPYLNDARVDNGFLYDAFGSPVEYYYFNTPLVGAGTVAYVSPADQFAIISRGPDLGSGNGSAANPNQFAAFNSTSPLPSAGSYATLAANLDNIVYPRFTYNSGLLNYQQTGTLNLNILNYDNNPGIASYVPACPGLFDMNITAPTRSDSWLGYNTGGGGLPPLYNPGGASFDLVQGIYRVQVRNATSPNGVVWDEQLSILPNAVQTRTLYLQGPDSSTTPNQTLTVTNNLGFGVSVYTYSTTTVLVGSVAAAGTGSFSVKGCGQVTVRNTANNSVVDSFVMPLATFSNSASTNVYTKVYNTSTFTYTLGNKGTGATKYLFLYQNGVLIGEVSKWGNRKSKTFTGLKQNDVLRIVKDSGAQQSTITMPGSNQANFF